MIATLLVALFATVALASAVTLADAAVRGRNAFRQLRGDLARIESVRRITVCFEEVAAEALVAEARMPALRPAVSAGRASQRRTARAAGSAPLRAAA